MLCSQIVTAIEMHKCLLQILCMVNVSPTVQEVDSTLSSNDMSALMA